MKKTIIIILLAISGSVSACKKNYTCTCADKNGIITGKYTYEKVKKKDASVSCDFYKSKQINEGTCWL